MVRETEEPTSQVVTLTVKLPPDQEAAERLSERAFGTMVTLLDRGIPLRLVTDEEGGRIAGAVADRRQAGRRLARAVAGQGTAGVELGPWASSTQ